TGCTLSSAIAAYMARGETIEAAVSKAKTYINEALRAGATFRLGHGNGPLHHFYRQWS
ncbi:MAG: bifunctional hydroxymethylpyrimidine kinase/phosphomethylpyrimidine kinase, partial [Chlorobiaceae bacterium]|nr:bifunctional hydroxymethylpyrimidine kinase/phosphomethylpyrimidine kinase [Chlorobiaceae bacterium]